MAGSIIKQAPEGQLSTIAANDTAFAVSGNKFVMMSALMADTWNNGVKTEIHFAASGESETILVNTDMTQIRAGKKMTIDSVHAYLKTPQTSGSDVTLTVDFLDIPSTVNLVFPNSTEFISVTGLSLSVDLTDKILVGCSQVGDGTARGAKIIISGKYAL